MSNEDYRQGYKDGFKDGIEEGKKLVEEQWRQDKIKELEKTLPKTPWGFGDYVFGVKDNCPGRVTCVFTDQWSIADSMSLSPMSKFSSEDLKRGAVGSDKEYDRRGWRTK